MSEEVVYEVIAERARERHWGVAVDPRNPEHVREVIKEAWRRV